jgi:hypothetical protein
MLYMAAMKLIIRPNAFRLWLYRSATILNFLIMSLSLPFSFKARWLNHLRFLRSSSLVNAFVFFLGHSE